MIGYRGESREEFYGITCPDDIQGVEDTYSCADCGEEYPESALGEDLTRIWAGVCWELVCRDCRREREESE